MACTGHHGKRWRLENISRLRLFVVSLMYDFNREQRYDNSAVGRARRSRQKEFQFIGVDGEGAGIGKEHRYVLLGCGNAYYENVEGISWKEAFTFLYDQFLQNPHAAFVGFFLGYDFTQIIKSMSEERARMLLTDRGISARKRKRSGGNTKPFPVRYDGWEFDMLPGRRLQIRPQACGCHERGQRDCPHKQFGWMYICDSGPFWQTSLLNAVDPRGWKFPICSPDEYQRLVVGKANRSMTLKEYIKNRQAVIDYNQTENKVFCRAMDELRHGFTAIGINLTRAQWFGPGQAAAAWFKKEKVPRRHVIEEKVPDWFLEAARKSYFGGWFEIFSHGIVPGISHEYDINSAYPYIIAQLPCLLHGRYARGDGRPSDKNIKGNQHEYVLVRARVSGNNPNIGSLLNRSKDGRIRRPWITEGWYWLHEIESAKNAGLVAEVEYREWCSYSPCDCPPPARGLRDLYLHRLRVGKESALGKGAKLVYNSGYGKFAQSTGSSPYGNWVYASLITAGCRGQILDAIATHPDRSEAVLMVATDAVFFDRPHPSLPISKELGQWDHKERPNLTLFKPGVYWDDKSRAAIRDGNAIGFKARGVNARDFARHIGTIDRKFLGALDPVPEFRTILFQSTKITAYAEEPWPSIEFEVGFTLTSAKTALNRGNWSEAGETQTDIVVTQDSDPQDKRRRPYLDRAKNRLRTHPIQLSDREVVSEPYNKNYGLEDPFSLDTQEWFGINPDGTTGMQMQALARLLSGEE
jgi:hypothetical protein